MTQPGAVLVLRGVELGWLEEAMWLPLTGVQGTPHPRQPQPSAVGGISVWGTGGAGPVGKQGGLSAVGLVFLFSLL